MKESCGGGSYANNWSADKNWVDQTFTIPGKYHGFARQQLVLLAARLVKMSRWDEEKSFRPPKFMDEERDPGEENGTWTRKWRKLLLHESGKIYLGCSLDGV